MSLNYGLFGIQNMQLLEARMPRQSGNLRFTDHKMQILGWESILLNVGYLMAARKEWRSVALLRILSVDSRPF